MPFEKIFGTPMGVLTLRALKAEKISALLDDAVWDEILTVQRKRCAKHPIVL